MKKFIFKKLDFFQKNPEKYSLGPLTHFWRSRKTPFFKGGYPSIREGGGPHIQNQCASNNNSDHHRDGDHSQNIIGTEKVSQNNYRSKNLAFIIPEPH